MVSLAESVCRDDTHDEADEKGARAVCQAEVLSQQCYEWSQA